MFSSSISYVRPDAEKLGLRKVSSTLTISAEARPPVMHASFPAEYIRPGRHLANLRRKRQRYRGRRRRAAPKHPFLAPEVHLCPPPPRGWLGNRSCLRTHDAPQCGGIERSGCRWVMSASVVPAKLSTSMIWPCGDPRKSRSGTIFSSGSMRTRKPSRTRSTPAQDHRRSCDIWAPLRDKAGRLTLNASRSCGDSDPAVDPLEAQRIIPWQAHTLRL
jgi:hypothetical protein